MHLRRQIIERPYPVAKFQKPVGQMGADKSRASSDQNVIHNVLLFRLDALILYSFH